MLISFSDYLNLWRVHVWFRSKYNQIRTLRFLSDKKNVVQCIHTEIK